ncbi:GAF domain-containing protein [Mucilaginibacter calamicampi]|uniref:GAF domain-containing protein n=1 Tax=Mucilaginibacter calamicampi TaxID=1302352 RepID=A0ABW2YZ49_9SPHI
MIDEKSRLEAVSRFTQINPDVAADLNELVDLAAQICNTPVALVTLIDEDVQWFKASKGVDMEGTARQLAFCNHTIQQNGLLVVPNMANDLRFTHNPLVAEAPHARFYAGATLVTSDGYNIGSLCVIDMEERDLDDTQRSALKTLSKQVMRLMELNWTMNALESRNDETERQKKLIEESELKLQAIFDSSKDTHVLVNKNLEILAFNKAADEFSIAEHGKPLQTGALITGFTAPKVVEPITKNLAKAFAGEIVRREWNVCPGREKECWMEVTFIPIADQNGNIIGVAINSADITDRKMQEDQINIQNAALTRIAIIQSHELRRPVASLLGIMALIKLEQNKGNSEYLEMLEYTVKELDQKICEIVKDSENTINGYMSIVA